MERTKRERRQRKAAGHQRTISGRDCRRYMRGRGKRGLAIPDGSISPGVWADREDWHSLSSPSGCYQTIIHSRPSSISPTAASPSSHFTSSTIQTSGYPLHTQAPSPPAQRTARHLHSDYPPLHTLSSIHLPSLHTFHHCIPSTAAFLISTSIFPSP